MAMSTLKEVFKPKNKKDALVVAIIFITVGSFISFEMYAVYAIMTDDHVGPYYSVRADTGTYLPLSGSDLYQYPADAVDKLLEISLSGRSGEIALNFTFHNCIYEKAALVYGEYGEQAGDSGTKVSLSVISLELVYIVEDKVVLNLNETTSGSIYYTLYVLVTPMAPSDQIGIYYSVYNLS